MLVVNLISFLNYFILLRPATISNLVWYHWKIEWCTVMDRKIKDAPKSKWIVLCY